MRGDRLGRPAAANRCTGGRSREAARRQEMGGHHTRAGAFMQAKGHAKTNCLAALSLQKAAKNDLDLTAYTTHRCSLARLLGHPPLLPQCRRLFACRRPPPRRQPPRRQCTTAAPRPPAAAVASMVSCCLPWLVRTESACDGRCSRQVGRWQGGGWGGGGHTHCWRLARLLPSLQTHANIMCTPPARGGSCSWLLLSVG